MPHNLCAAMRIFSLRQEAETWTVEEKITHRMRPPRIPAALHFTVCRRPPATIFFPLPPLAPLQIHEYEYAARMRAPGSRTLPTHPVARNTTPLPADQMSRDQGGGKKCGYTNSGDFSELCNVDLSLFNRTLKRVHALMAETVPALSHRPVRLGSLQHSSGVSLSKSCTDVQTCSPHTAPTPPAPRMSILYGRSCCW